MEYKCERPQANKHAVLFSGHVPVIQIVSRDKDRRAHGPQQDRTVEGNVASSSNTSFDIGSDVIRGFTVFKEKDLRSLVTTTLAYFT